MSDEQNGTLLCEDFYKEKATMNIQLYETPGNNHGCRGFEVSLRVINQRTAEVVDGSSCSSCWQVGHDNGESPIPVGTVVLLPNEYQGTWEQAREEIGRSHNELVNDTDDDPQSDTTRVKPSELVWDRLGASMSTDIVESTTGSV